MKIRLNTIYAGPDGCSQPGDVITVSESVGKRLVAMRAGVEVADEPKPEPVKEKAIQPETATIKPSESSIGVRRGRPRKV